MAKSKPLRKKKAARAACSSKAQASESKANSGLQALRLEVFHHLLASVAEEMGAHLRRSAFSPNIRERRDFSCALFDARGRMLSQAAHIPIHLGSAPLCAQAVLADCELKPGDAVLLNDPFRGGTHLPDLTLVTPVFLEGSQPTFLVANRAHHADVGGAYPGSMSPTLDVHGEGLRIPPIHLVRENKIQRDVLGLLCANMRMPAEREGDLLAQWSANRYGVRRFEELAQESSVAELREQGEALLRWTASTTRAFVSSLPQGDFQFSDRLELGDAEAQLRLTIRSRPKLAKSKQKGAKRLQFDFSESDDAVAAPVNTTRAVVVSAVFYVLRLLLSREHPGLPTNDGLLDPVEIVTRSGSLLDAAYPAPVCAGNVETSQRTVDVLLGALAQALPDCIPAASAGTMSNLTFGGRLSGSQVNSGSGFSYYETIAGGAGAGPEGAGAHVVQTHMTNTRNTPIEAFETQLPVRVLQNTVRRGSGGRGAARGGDGLRRELLFLEPARLGFVADRQVCGPWALAGGEAGQAGRVFHSRNVKSSSPEKIQPRVLPGDIHWTRVSPPLSLDLSAGDALRIETPGGGGFGGAGKSD